MGFPVQAIAVSCGEHAEITDRLGRKYAELRIGFGRLDDGRLVEIFASPRGTWTLLVTRPNGPTCLVGWGDGWETIADPKIEESAI